MELAGDQRAPRCHASGDRRQRKAAPVSRAQPPLATARIQPDGIIWAQDGLIAALVAFKALDTRVSLNELIAFLYVGRREGLSVQELADQTGFTQSTASRSLRALGPDGCAWTRPPALGLVEAFVNPRDSRSHVVCLTDRGRSLRQHLLGLLGPDT